MKVISSRATFLYKRVFPLFWFGILAIITVIGFGNATTRGFATERLFGLLFPVGMAVFAFFVLKFTVFCLMDKVFDVGDALIVKKNGVQETIQLADIINISHSTFSGPTRAVITLRKPCRLGKEIAFIPPMTLIPFRTPPIIRELIERVDAKRGR